jgi:hypothetical protein
VPPPLRAIFQSILKVVVITGFNTDIEHRGTVYHVQTEDKGLETPIILSLVYVGGAILASKRAPYNDLLAAGFDPVQLGERLQRQHKLICAAISAGRIEDLKRLNQRETAAQPVEQSAPEASAPTPPKGKASATPDATRAEKPRAVSTKASTEVKTDVENRTAPVVSPVEASTSVPHEAEAAEVIPAELEDELHVSLLEEKDFRAGEMVTLRVSVTRGAFGERTTVRAASVTVKILGTSFRPLILTSKTDADGVAVVHVWLPRFASGRAAILVRASADDCTAELRRVIHHV